MKGNTILITGASGGIGTEIAKGLAKKDTTVGLHYNHDKRAALTLADQIAKKDATPVLLQADLSNPKDRNALLNNIKNKMKFCDILINNAGGTICEKMFGDYTDSDAYSILELNFLSAFFLSQELFPSMCSRKFGRIVNISSIGVKFGGGKSTLLYSAAKAALELMTINLAKLGADQNVNVNAIRAGVIDTPFHKRNTPNKDMTERISLIPMKHSGTPLDIANMAEYLVGFKGDFITGQIFTVSGGE